MREDLREALTKERNTKNAQILFRKVAQKLPTQVKEDEKTLKQRQRARL